MIDINVDWQQLITNTGTVAAFVASVVALYKLIILPIKKLISKLVAISTTINKMAEEFTPNGGSSLKDAISRIELAIAFNQGTENVLASILGVALWKAGKDGKMTWANSKLCELFGLDNDDMIGSGWINGIMEHDRDDVVEAWSNAVKEKRRYENNYSLNNGTMVHASANRILDERGELAGYVGTIRQIHNGTAICPFVASGICKI
jgi:PAS domain S-box-containing protein